VQSASLQRWQTDRLTRLKQIESQSAAILAAVPPNAQLIEEILRGYVLLLSAHFQGFCRDLYSEAAFVLASKVRFSLRVVIQEQFTAHRKLDRGNPTVEHLKDDFNRFGFALDFAVDPANVARLKDLSEMHKWRNTAAHQSIAPAGISLDLVALKRWRDSCDGLAFFLDSVLYNQLRRLMRRSPW
jgi:HEPN superfamily RiboL-PSP-like protein